jgi:phenylpropionate dioxygenase-like ring-hydroxylating dioxygenase large terminal subunit
VHDVSGHAAEALPVSAPEPERIARVFANRDATSRSWYPAMRSRALPRGRIRILELRQRRIAIYRDSTGRAHAMDARCPHLGADLSLGTVEQDRVRCAFHGWCFGPDGFCHDAPGHDTPPRRRARVYPCEERWGFVWIFNGPTPLFPLPTTSDGRWRALRLPSQRIACHPHLVLANGLDIAHYEELHGLAFTEPPTLTVGPHEVCLSLRGRARTGFWRFISGTRRGEIVARFATIGGSLAWTTVESPVRFHVLFTGRPDRESRCVTQTLFLFPMAFNLDWLRAFGAMAMLLHDDRRILDTIDFRPDFDANDEPLRAYARVVDDLGAW